MTARAAAAHEVAAGVPYETATGSAFGIGSHLIGRCTGAEQGVGDGRTEMVTTKF